MEYRDSGDVFPRSVPSFIEARPPGMLLPFGKPKPIHLTFDEETYFDDTAAVEKEHYKVYLRMKPCSITSDVYDIKSSTCLIINDTEPVKKGHSKISKMYIFSQIFTPEATQAELFENVVKDNLVNLMEHSSFTLLTYGASGAGKTYTLMGTVNRPGLVPRSLEYLFKLANPSLKPVYKPKDGSIQELDFEEQQMECQLTSGLHKKCHKTKTYRRMSVRLSTELFSTSCSAEKQDKHYIWVSFVEIYNENVYDLLEPPDKRQNVRLRICEDPRLGVFIKGLKHIYVRSGAEAYDVMIYGQNNLTFATTGVNSNSSRSHSIFTITLITVTSDGKTSTSRLRLCDLAGAERVSRTKNVADRLHESKHINSSLYILERCLRSLQRKQNTQNTCMVPFRESKLTRILSGALSGVSHENVGIVINVNPHPDFLMETKHVLKLVSVARSITINNATESTVTSQESCDTTVSEKLHHELIVLRNENDKLHFELERALKALEELQLETQQDRERNYDAMRDLVREATEQGEKNQRRLDEFEINSLKQENQRLLKRNAVLEEELSSAVHRYNSSECEAEYLRGCLEERDGGSDNDQGNDKGQLLNTNQVESAKKQSIVTVDDSCSSTSDSELDTDESSTGSSDEDELSQISNDEEMKKKYSEVSSTHANKSLDDVKNQSCSSKEKNDHEPYLKEIERESTDDVIDKCNRNSIPPEQYTEAPKEEYGSPEKNRTSAENTPETCVKQRLASLHINDYSDFIEQDDLEKDDLVKAVLTAQPYENCEEELRQDIALEHIVKDTNIMEDDIVAVQVQKNAGSVNEEYGTAKDAEHTMHEIDLETAAKPDEANKYRSLNTFEPMNVNDNTENIIECTQHEELKQTIGEDGETIRQEVNSNNATNNTDKTVVIMKLDDEAIMKNDHVLKSIENVQKDANLKLDETCKTNDATLKLDETSKTIDNLSKSMRRRKLWTPREDLVDKNESVDSEEVKPRVLRPSYRKTRARRKL